MSRHPLFFVVVVVVVSFFLTNIFTNQRNRQLAKRSSCFSINNWRNADGWERVREERMGWVERFNRWILSGSSSCRFHRRLWLQKERTVRAIHSTKKDSTAYDDDERQLCNKKSYLVDSSSRCVHQFVDLIWLNVLPVNTPLSSTHTQQTLRYGDGTTVRTCPVTLVLLTFHRKW